MPANAATIGAYRLIEPLGRGGMGVVWRAEHLESGQAVALKTVKVPNGWLLQSLRREIHALARLRHPGIVRIVDEGMHEGMPWYAMELLKGVSLRRWRRELPSAETVATPLDGSVTPVTPQVEPDRWWTRPLEPGPSVMAPPESGPAGTAMMEPGPAGTAMMKPVAAGPELQLDAARQRRMSAPVARVAVPPEVVKAPPLRAILTLARRLCSALAHLHGEGIVHRDLKPENILVIGGRGANSAADPEPGARSPDPVIVDFGLAAYFGGELSREVLLVEAGAVGTLAYMAPEQVRGELPDARADLYALGCILYELLTGRRPIEPRSQSQTESHPLGVPLLPSRLVPGVPPALDELVLHLLARQPRDRLGHADVVAAVLDELGAEDGLGTSEQRPQAYLYRPDFAGREQPLAVLRERLNVLVRGKGGSVLVGGESGVGKTRLVVELGREAVKQGIQVLAGESLDVGGGPLQALRKPLQALCDRCQERGLDEAESIFGARGPVLALYEPAIRHLAGQAAYPVPADLPLKDAMLRLFRCLLETLSAAAARSGKLLLILDDLQWTDELTAGFLEHLARIGAGAPLLFVGTYRSEDVGTQRAAPLRRLIDAAEPAAILLGRLDEPAVAAIVGDMLALRPPPALLSRFLVQHSEGSPFFVAEYLRAAVAEGLLWRDAAGRWQVADPTDGGAQPAAASGTGQALPAQYAALPLPHSLRDLVGRRLEGLAEGARKLAEAAAVLGREASVLVLRQMTGLEEVELFAATDQLLRRQVLEDEATTGRPPRLRFVHDKIREVAYERLAGSVRSRLHRAAAEAIEEAQAAERQEHLAELGQHWEAAGEPAKARACYLPAARGAAQRHAHEEAERLYRAYLHLVEEPTAESIAARNELGEKVLQLRGRSDEALGEHEKSLSESRVIGNRALESEGFRLLGVIHAFTGRMEEAEHLYGQALAIARESGERRGEGHALGNLAGLHYAQGRLDEARQLYEQALAINLELGDRRREGHVLGNLAILHAQQGRPEAPALFEKALVLAREVGDRRNEGIVLGNLAILHKEQGRLDQARQLYEQAVALAREVGDRRNEGIVLGNLAILLKEQGRLEDAHQLYEQAVAVARQIGDRPGEGIVLGDLASLELLARGNLQHAGKLAEEAEHRLAGLGDPLELGKLLCCRGHIALAGGRSARELLERGEALASTLEAGPDSLLGKALLRLRGATDAFEAGQQERLFRGHLLEDLPAGLRRGLQRSGQMPPEASSERGAPGPGGSQDLAGRSTSAEEG